MEPPGYIKCGCGRIYPMTTANTVVNSYWFQPWFAWARSLCDCGEEHKNFFGPRHWQQQCERFTETSIGFVVESFFAPPAVIKAFTEVYREQLRIPVATDLGDAEKAQVAFFRYLLERGDQA